MKILTDCPARLRIFEIALGPEKRIHFLTVIITEQQKRFVLTDYYGWPVFGGLLVEAENKYNRFVLESGEFYPGLTGYQVISEKETD